MTARQALAAIVLAVLLVPTPVWWAVTTIRDAAADVAAAWRCEG